MGRRAGRASLRRRSALPVRIVGSVVELDDDPWHQIRCRLQTDDQRNALRGNGREDIDVVAFVLSSFDRRVRSFRAYRVRIQTQMPMNRRLAVMTAQMDVDEWGESQGPKEQTDRGGGNEGAHCRDYQPAEEACQTESLVRTEVLQSGYSNRYRVSTCPDAGRVLYMRR